MELVKVNGRYDRRKLLVGIIVPVIGGSVLGWLANRNAQEKYRRLEKPSFSPPSSVFPIAWTTLYCTMGLAKYRMDMNTRFHYLNKTAIPLYELQLGLNFLWSFLFFRWGLRGTALIEMTILLGTIALTAYQFFQVDMIAGTLMIPYIMWVMFALALNYSIWKLNK